MKFILLRLGIRDKQSFFIFCIQFLKFGAVGITNTIVSLVIYYILISVHMHYIIANLIAFAISVLNAYIWNNRYVFKGKTSSVKNIIIRIYIAYGLTFIISTVFLFIMVDILHISKIIAPIINLLITIPANFLLNKFWVFKER